MAVADGEELGFGERAAHVVEEGAGGVHALADEVEVFLHLGDVELFGEVGPLRGAVEVFDIAADVGEGEARDGLAGELFAALTEDPRVSDGVASDHDARGAGRGDDGGGFGGGGDVAVGEHGAADAGDGVGDGVVVNFAAIHLFHGAAVHGEEVDAVLVDQVEDAVVVARILEADTHFDGEEAGYGGAESGEDFTDFLGFAQEAAADVFLVNFRRGAAEVEVDAGDRVAKEFFDGAREVVDVFADQLGEKGATGGVFVDRAEDVFLGFRLSVNAEEFGDVVIGCAVAGDDAHEREIGDVLHRG